MKKTVLIVSAILAVLAIAAALTLLLPKAAAPAGTAQSTQGTQGTQGTEAPLCSLMGRGHVYSGGVCVFCGEKEATESKHFLFTLLENGTYSVAAAEGALLPPELVLPSEHEGVYVTEVSPRGFEGHTEIESVTFSENIKKLNFSSFDGCTGLRALSFEGDALRVVENRAFGGCTSLTEISLPQGLVTLGVSAFTDCTSLASVRLPQSLLYIGIRCFENCSALRDIVLPQRLKSISDNAFEGCTSLTALMIPASVESIGTAVFDRCGDISVDVREGGRYASRGGCLIDMGEKAVIFGTGKSTIPADGSVSTIGVYAFCNRKDITSLALPLGVTHISRYAFAACTALVRADLGGATTIGSGAFLMCESLETVVLPKSVEKIYDKALDNCPNLTAIIYGGTVEEWHAIEKYELRGAVTVYCTDGEVKL